MKHAANPNHMSNHQAHNHSKHGAPSRPKWLVVVGGVLLALVVVGAICGVMLFFSVRTVTDRAHLARDQAAAITQNMLDGDGEALHSNTDALIQTVDTIQSEMHGPAWYVASVVPFVGRDVSNAQQLSDCAADIVHNALDPFTDNVAGIKLSDLVQERRVDTQLLGSLRGIVVEVSPVLARNAQTMSTMKRGSIGKVNELIDSLATPMASMGELLNNADQVFSIVLSMLGDGGQTRTYVIIAQNNAEIKAAGGFMGSMGVISITDGNMELGEFNGVSDYKNRISSAGYGAPITQDEASAFGDVLSTDAAGSTLTPNFVRVGEITSDLWEHAFGTHVDGVLGLDPIFLQRVLALTGGIVTDDGTAVNGDNAAYEVLSNVYWRYGYSENGNDYEDAFFNDVAHKSFGALLDSMGNFEIAQFGNLWDVVKKSGSDRRFQVWMQDPTTQDFLHKYDLTGELQQDVARPELGIYADDNTWAKLAWYLDITADVDEGTKNADGSTTHHVTAHFKNSITEDEAERAPAYVSGGQPLKRAKSDLVETVYIMAPLNGSIANYEVHQDAPLPPESVIPSDQQVLYGRDTMSSRINILGGGDTTITFDLTVPAEATEPLLVRTSPLCHE